MKRKKDQHRFAQRGRYFCYKETSMSLKITRLEKSHTRKHGTYEGNAVRDTILKNFVIHTQKIET